MRSKLNLKPQLHGAATVWKGTTEKSRSFHVQASRYRGVLHFVAYRVLGDPDKADIAVENCLLAAVRLLRPFDSEGAFRRWLARIAIDEALAILHGRSVPVHRRELGVEGVRTARCDIRE